MEEAGDRVPALLTSLGPDMYRRNAFRVLGLAVDASQREVSRRLQEFRIESKLGAGGGRGPAAPLPLVPPPEESGLREAAGRLRDPRSRFLEEFFWPWPLEAGERDHPDEALSALERGDVAGALGAWEAEAAPEAPRRGVSAHNLAVVYHVLALDLECLAELGALSPQQVKQKRAYWTKAMACWRAAVGEQGLWEAAEKRALALGDPRLDREAVAGLRAALPVALLCVNARLAARAAQNGDLEQARWHADVVKQSGEGAEGIDRALLLAVEPARETTGVVGAACDQEAEADPGRGAEVALRLLDSTGPSLAVLDALLPPGHPVSTAQHDEVATRVLRYQVAYAKKTDDWALSLDLLKRVLPLARGDEARKRLQENITIVENNLRLSSCWFCGKEKADDAAAVKVHMHRVVSRTPTPTGVRVHWQKLEAQVPRCRRCKGAHARAGSFVSLGCSLGLLLGVGGCVAAAASHGPQYLGLAWLILMAGIAIVVRGLGPAGLRRRGIKPEAAKADFPGLKRLKSEGWIVGEKPSGV